MTGGPQQYGGAYEPYEQHEPYEPHEPYGQYGQYDAPHEQYGQYGQAPGEPYDAQGYPQQQHAQPGEHDPYAYPQQQPHPQPAAPAAGPVPPQGGPSQGYPEQEATSDTTAMPTVPSPGSSPTPDPAPAPARSARRAPSPIIPPGIQPAAVTAALALLLAFTAPLPQAVFAVPVLLLQAVTAAGWFRLNGMWPARQGIALAFLAGVTADVALLTAGREHTGTVLLGSLGAWCVLAIVLQLRNRSNPDERLYALTAGFTATALTVLAAGHLAIVPTNEDAVTVGAIAVGVAALARALPMPPFVSPVVALFAAAGAGIAAGQATGMDTDGALLGLAAGVCALIGLRAASYDFPSRFVHMTAGVALPLTVASPAVYVLGRALV